ncbi:MAG: A/G-specific adenine glycosylase, partial [Anaerolineae bacterium]
MPSLPSLAQLFLAWYENHQRPLPWRDGSDPYAIWVAEVMLQQTQARTVVPYYTKFIRRFPTAESLAAASLDEVLKAWEGMGYYARARNLHDAARRVVERHGGRVPDTLATLRELPGIGRYTAGAIVSIAYGIPAPALDANARRVLSRVYLVDGDPGDRAIETQLWDLAGSLVPPERPGDFNQAIMELGATICLPRRPKCGRCPVARRCGARELGRQEEIPRRAAPRRRPH